MNNELIERIDKALADIEAEEEAFASVSGSVAHIADDIAARKSLLLDCKAALTHMAEDLEAVVAKHASLSIALTQQQETEPVGYLSDANRIALLEGRNTRIYAEPTPWVHLPAFLHPPKPAAQPVDERKCSECGDGSENLSLYCVSCLNHDGWHLMTEEEQAAQPQVPESRNIRAVEMHGDQSVLVSFPSCRSASAFAGWLYAAKEEL